MTPPIKKKAMVKPLTAKGIAQMIERQVSYFNGWEVSEKTMKLSCLEAAIAITKALNRRSR